MLTEHCRLKGHPYKMGLAIDNICRVYGEEAEQQHLLNQISKLLEKVRQVLND